jgi:hypothetical protein
MLFCDRIQVGQRSKHLLLALPVQTKCGHRKIWCSTLCTAEASRTPHSAVNAPHAAPRTCHALLLRRKCRQLAQHGRVPFVHQLDAQLELR